MTVAELRKALENVPGDAQVYMSDWEELARVIVQPTIDEYPNGTTFDNVCVVLTDVDAADKEE